MKQATEQATPEGWKALPEGIVVRRVPAGAALRVGNSPECLLTGDEARAVAEALVEAVREMCGVPGCQRGWDRQWFIAEETYRLCDKHGRPFERMWERLGEQQYAKGRREEERGEKRLLSLGVRWMREHKVRASMEDVE